MYHDDAAYVHRARTLTDGEDGADDEDGDGRALVAARLAQDGVRGLHPDRS